ncbi:hypothetical protein GCM10007891_19350 [Methylophaga thalassica]|uniref:Uncharacterized protein n=1 Tax=Methylophaga thalassica TaxID=40223 RepID=A0ABQ5TV77_9GAMM|nr:hypothetical protein [Methylophaga thalassica]GLQ00082.1 hypothetical protein GCM10007891_19350 [Methylophaga thalassica]
MNKNTVSMIGLHVSKNEITELPDGLFLIEKTYNGQKFSVTHDDLTAGIEAMKSLIESNCMRAITQPSQ